MNSKSTRYNTCAAFLAISLLLPMAILAQNPAPLEQQQSPGHQLLPIDAQNATGGTALALPPGTSMQVEIQRQYPMKNGEAIEGTLLHPIYADGRLVVPKGTTVRGKVVSLDPDGKARLHARLLGDFTPFHRAEVRFDVLELAGRTVPIDAATADNGAPVLQLTSPGATLKRSLVAREIAMAKARLRERVDWFTAPGFKDRALQMLYHELPYHPEAIAPHTAWSFELKSALDVSNTPQGNSVPSGPRG